MNNKDFGIFIKNKRIEKGLSQKELANILYVTDSAVSKWERGLSYPDITMVESICKALDISEHELITASNDTHYRIEKSQAKNYRTIRMSWIIVPAICYAIAIFTCFICNLAVNHTLSWFFIVLASLICAFSFVPTFSIFVKKYKFLVFVVSTFISINLVLLVCGICTHNLFPMLIAFLGILIGYIFIFVPVFIKIYFKQKILQDCKFLIAITLAFLVTVLLICVNRARSEFNLIGSILICLYGYSSLWICAGLCLTKQNKILKIGECMIIISIFSYLSDLVSGILLNEPYSADYIINFSNWTDCLSANVSFIVFLSLVFVSLCLIIIGIIRANIISKIIMKRK